jgi:hypothetical protein
MKNWKVGDIIPWNPFRKGYKINLKRKKWKISSDLLEKSPAGPLIPVDKSPLTIDYNFTDEPFISDNKRDRKFNSERFFSEDEREKKPVIDLNDSDEVEVPSRKIYLMQFKIWAPETDPIGSRPIITLYKIGYSSDPKNRGKGLLKGLRNFYSNICHVNGLILFQSKPYITKSAAKIEEAILNQTKKYAAFPTNEFGQGPHLMWKSTGRANQLVYYRNLWKLMQEKNVYTLDGITKGEVVNYIKSLENITDKDFVKQGRWLDGVSEFRTEESWEKLWDLFLWLLYKVPVSTAEEKIENIKNDKKKLSKKRKLLDNEISEYLVKRMEYLE